MYLFTIYILFHLINGQTTAKIGKNIWNIVKNGVFAV